MIDVTRQVLLLRRLLLCCRPKVAELDYENGCTEQYWRDCQKACWEMALERSLLIDYPEIKGIKSPLTFEATIYPSSGRVIDPEAPITHKLVCLPKEEMSGMWIARDATNWHYLDREQPILWTEESLDNFFFKTFGSWKYFLEQNLTKHSNFNDPLFSVYSLSSFRRVPNLPPMDSVWFYFVRNGRPNFHGVAKANELTFYLKEIEETPKMSFEDSQREEEQEEMVARIGALIDKRVEGIGEWWKHGYRE